MIEVTVVEAFGGLNVLYNNAGNLPAATTAARPRRPKSTWNTSWR